MHGAPPHDFLVGTGEPRQNPNITFMGSSKANKFLVNFENKLGLGQIPNFYRKFVLGAPLKDN